MITVYDLGSLADWVVAFGTVSAVIVALYLANRDRKPRAVITSSVSYPVTGPELSPYPLTLNLSIVNIGSIPIHLKECSLQLSKRPKKKLAFLTGNPHIVDKLLVPGEHYVHSLPYDNLRGFYLDRGKNKLTTYGFFEDGRGKRYKTKVHLYFKD